MKTKINDLKNRGYITDKDIVNYNNLSLDEIISLLDSFKSYERTIAIRLLYNKEISNNNIIKKLLDKLKQEKSLYTKIEICKYLKKYNNCDLMIKYLGIIGNNQYKEIGKTSNKKSYPLPRDIIARTLGKTNEKNIDILFKVLDTNNMIQISEVIDAIGYMIFYNENLDTLDNFNIITKNIERYFNNELILWKLITCLSAFNSKECINYLYELDKRINNEKLLKEIKRSIKLITNKKGI